MPRAGTQRLRTPREEDLGLERVGNRSGLRISRLPNGAIFAIEHVQADRRIMINQSFGSPIAGGMGGVYLRVGGSAPTILPVAGAEARCRIGGDRDRFLWEGAARGLAHQVSLRLHADESFWTWRVEVRNGRNVTLPCDSLLIQDLGLGEPAFLMNNEAYASQYIDQHVARHPRTGYVLIARQNLAQERKHPWVMHGCLQGAVGFATDFRQLMGPAHRDADGLCVPFGTSLPSIRLQHESACAALQSAPVQLAPGAATSWTFFGAYQSDHPGASTDADLALIERALIDKPPEGAVPPPQRAVRLSLPARSLLQDACPAVAEPLDEEAIEERYPQRTHAERRDGRLLSFFAPGEISSRHVVLRDKERMVLRRHGALLRGGGGMLPSDATVSITCWMHGVFGAQLAIGNTALHRLFSVSRDPYNVNRGSGLRLLLDAGEGWRLLTVPSLFEMGLEDCRWIYRLAERTLTVSVAVAGEEPAVQWRVAVEGPPCRFLAFWHLALGEREFTHAAQLEIDTLQKRFMFRPDPQHVWGRHYPEALYQLVTSTPGSVEAVGADELLYPDGRRRSGAYGAMRTSPTCAFAFAVVGSLTDPRRAELLSARYAASVDDAAMHEGSRRYWRNVTRGVRIESTGTDVGAADADARAMDTIFPWLVHDAMVHLSVPQGLEQYTGGAWGTRDVCQGPIELLLSLEHDEPAQAILRVVLAEQYAQRGDWPQWFMLEPYSAIRDGQAAGDVIVWPLKAVCDYLEATGDLTFLDEAVPWRREDNLERSDAPDPIATHLDKLIATVRARFVPGTHLLRYGNGDWNDALQPVDPAWRDSMVSSWTVALLYEQLCRYAEIVRRAGRSDGAAEERLAAAMREDFNRFLIRDGTVAGYGLFSPGGGAPELLFHPHDERTGIAYSLLPMTQAIIGGLFTPEQAQHHLGLIRKHLTFPDGVRLMNRPVDYHGGPERVFQRAESAAFFGREIGLMYSHAHLRYAQALAVLGEAQELWDALLIVNPIAVTDRLAHAALRQRNTYFSSSDAAFRDRYQASAEWERTRTADITLEGGWRMYSSGPGLYTNVIIRHVLGMRRHFGARIVKPCLPASLAGLTLKWTARPASGSPLP